MAASQSTKRVDNYQLIGEINSNMGDKSPKANQKASKQKDAKNSSEDQKKKAAAAAKAAKPGKK